MFTKCKSNYLKLIFNIKCWVMEIVRKNIEYKYSNFNSCTRYRTFYVIHQKYNI